MEKNIVTLSDTSHPFTTITDETDIATFGNADRTLTTPEFAAIGVFESKWGYASNAEMGDDLVDMLADETTPTNDLINRFMRKWGLDEEIRTDVQNLFVLRTTVMFTPDEVKDLESLEGEKSDKTLRNELFREEADKRVIRYFIGQSGWAWFVHIIVDMPEKYDADNNRIRSLYEAKDGMTTLHTTSIFMSEEKAWDYVNEDIRFITQFNDGTLTHVIELDKM